MLQSQWDTVGQKNEASGLKWPQGDVEGAPRVTAQSGKIV